MPRGKKELAEQIIPKLDVEGSSPFARSCFTPAVPSMATAVWSVAFRLSAPRASVEKQAGNSLVDIPKNSVVV